VYPTYNGERGHPPLIPYVFAAGIKDYDGEDGMRGFLSMYPFEEVDVNDRGTLLDMDTPRDYEALLTHLGLPACPDENTCNRLLEKYQTPDNVITHCRQVRELALRIADLLGHKGVAIDKGLLSSACLLHDIARLEPAHATAGAKVLLMEGYPAAARLIAVHMDLPGDYSPKPDETALLYLADKLSRYGKITTFEETLDVLRTRYASDPEALGHAERRIENARMILEMLQNRFKITYQDITGTHFE
jgi:hypothetical protein